MSFFLKSGSKFKVTTKEALDIHERLPTATYSAAFDSCSGKYYLETIGSFDIKGKLYGDTNHKAERILHSFYDREASTGVLLTGEKGSGKTMLAKRIAILAAEKDIPTIVVNHPWCGEDFNSFVQMIDQPAVFIFDEFEKVYAQHEKQQALLTLLDGIYPSKKLFLFTCNNKWKLNSNMLNRPGRIYYMLEYKGLDHSFVKEYCEDNLNNKERIPMVCSTAQVFGAFNFDMLKALVEEMNRFEETPAEALEFLNVRPAFNDAKDYSLQLFLEGTKLQDMRKHGYPNKWQGNPLKDVIRTVFRSDDGERKTICFTAQDLQQMDSKSGGFIFVKKPVGHKLLLRPMKSQFDVDFAAVQAFAPTCDTPETGSETEEDPIVVDDGGDY